MRGSVWGVAEECGDARLERCRAFMPVPGPLQSVQRAEFWVPLLLCSRTGLVIWVLITSMLLGLLVGCWVKAVWLKPLPLVKDRYLVAIAQYMIRARRQDTVRVTKVKGLSTEVDVLQDRVREEDRLGNAEAEAAADLGRRHLSDAGRAILQLHRFMVANVQSCCQSHHGRGGSAPGPLVWDQGSERKQRKTDIRVNVDLAFLPGPPGFLNGPWVQVHGGCSGCLAVQC